ncbi:flagellar hook-basal body complex protein FliE [Desulfallas sp. Bu1-1]|uniref:flagellar hook-basal body complex protein FliE n=1 Tax=Desulfallas sp. Bu1-1 TaxID=2787620 RepID=UPI0028BDB828|nr:flagellar hook-basal body complex protein FliE [Desulfallas sp. Bu1-1]
MEITPVALPLSQNIGPVKDNNTTGALVGSPEENISFKDIFDTALQNLNKSQIKAEETVKKFLTGEVEDVHTVIIAMEEARLTMQLAVEVRNKLVEAYQELSRMQV